MVVTVQINLNLGKLDVDILPIGLGIKAKKPTYLHHALTERKVPIQVLYE